MPRARWSLPDVLVSVALVLVLSTFAVSQVAMNRETQNRVRCASNLRQIGQAILLYANENRGACPRTAYDPAKPTPTWGTPYEGKPDLGPVDKANPFAKDDSPVAKTRPAANDVTAPLFLLMRTEEIASPAFVCPSEGIAFDDFGGGRHDATHWTNFRGNAGTRDHLSYSYANPYPSADAAKAGYRLNNALPPDFAVVADMNPGGDAMMKVTPISPPDIMRRANSLNHGRDGQNVLFGDGHVDFVTHPFVGVHRDNIYTFGPSAEHAGAGVVGSPADAGDSILLPTAADVGKTEEAIRKRNQVAGKLLSPEEEKRLRERLVGRYARQTPNGGPRVTLTITDNRISAVSDADRITYTYDLRGAVNDTIHATLANPFSPPADATFIATDKTLTVQTIGPLTGEWKRQ